MSRPLLLATCLFLIGGTTSSSTDKYFVLRNANSGFVLDASEEWVTAQPFTGFSSQLWKLEPARNGAVYVVSKFDGRVLDYDARYDLRDSWLVVSDKIGAQGGDSCMVNYYASDKSVNLPNCQLWHVHFFGRIVNACQDGKYAATITDNKQGSYPTTKAIGIGEQSFNFQYV